MTSWHNIILMTIIAMTNATCTHSQQMKKHTNQLIHESSPYLLQHAHNPVNWLPWTEQSLQKAVDEDKPLLISIGYSACHWCHVMEHESFENPEIAAIMNAHFICIKVDREELPDVDQVYMDALQLMTGQGGWPLNCFALPDGKPFFGGTYFPVDAWKNILITVNEAFRNDREKLEKYASELTEGIGHMNALPLFQVPEIFTSDSIDAAVARWSQRFDRVNGGNQGAPKFPMPDNLIFLLQYAHTQGDSDILKHVHLTLHQMAFGGIYDQLGGGFARYSVDERWKVPHFEKMLYDNAQLISLYSQAYAESKNELFKDIAEECIQFMLRDLRSNQGAFYAALDADSEGEEGKYYTWTRDELIRIAGDQFPIISQYYSVNETGLWEANRYILIRKPSASAIAESLSLPISKIESAIIDFKSNALKERTKRIMPGLDDKIITSWNAMAAQGLTDAYIALGNDKYLDAAKANLDFLLKIQQKGDGSLWHTHRNGKSSVNGFLEDYAHLCAALIRYYEASFDPYYLECANRLALHVRKHFKRTDSGMYYFKSSEDAPLIAQKAEITDNVTASSNAVFAVVLYKLGFLYDQFTFIEDSKRMLAAVEQGFTRYPEGNSHWMQQMLRCTEPFFEIAIVGEQCEEKRKELSSHYVPMALICGAKNQSDIPILQNRSVHNQTLIYVCRNGTCKLPVHTVDEALLQMR